MRLNTGTRIPAKWRGILVVLLLLLVVFRWCRTQSPDGEQFNRHPQKLSYTRHARCRMDCREVSEAEVKAILENGNINPRKSDPADKPCPSYAVEGYSPIDKQHLRIVFGQCGSETKVITCIDLDQDFTCNCN